MTVVLNTDLLEELASRLRSQGVPAIAIARAGLSEDEMQALVAPLGITLPIEARVWWGWHDGVGRSVGVEAVIGGLFRWQSLAEAVDECAQARRTVAHGASDVPIDPNDWWSPTWLPLVKGGGSIVIDTDVPEGAPSPLRAYWFDEPEAPVDLPSVGELVRLWINALDIGMWRYTPQGWWLDHDMRARDDLAKRGVM